MLGLLALGKNSDILNVCERRGVLGTARCQQNCLLAHNFHTLSMSGKTNTVLQTQGRNLMGGGKVVAICQEIDS